MFQIHSPNEEQNCIKSKNEYISQLLIDKHYIFEPIELDLVRNKFLYFDLADNNAKKSETPILICPLRFYAATVLSTVGKL